MATRTISTKLAIQGEAEYKASLSRINNELKTLQSGLKLSESSFKGQANSMEALRSKGDALNKLFEGQQQKVNELAKALENAQQAVQKYAQRKEELSQKLTANQQALDELRQSTDDTSEAEAQLAEENQKLNQELNQNEQYLNAAQRGANDWQTALNNAQTDLNELGHEIKQNNQYLDEAANNADGCADSIDEFGESTRQGADAAGELQEALGAAGLLGAFEAISEGLRACVEAAIEFESAMAGVAKTTNMSDSGVAAMGDSIKDLATKIPASTTEIAGVAEAAGQLGIKKDDILKFTEVMINLGVATNLSSDEAASSLAKFANVVGMSSGDYERLGSTIVDLGNNFATTEADIVSMATRIASAGTLIGLSEPEIMGVATALSSLGIEAEAGGSAISTLLKKFETMVATGNPQLKKFAEVAGMSCEDFAKAWGEDAVGALSKFIDGLGAIDEAGGSSVAVLDELGLKEIRLSNAVLSMASSQGILEGAVKKANDAWDKNTALAKEAETRYNTTESKLQMLRNAFNNVCISIGQDLTPALKNLADAGIDALGWAADFIDDHEALVPIITSLVTTLATFVGGIGAYVAITKIATAVQAAFNLVLNTNPIVLAITAVGALAAGIAILAATTRNDAIPSVRELTEAASDVGDAFDDAEEKFKTSEDSIKGSANLARDYVTRLKDLESQGLKTKEAQREYATTVELLNTLLPDLNLTIDEQTGLLNENYDSIMAQIDAWEEYGVKQALLEKFKTEIKAYSDAEAELYTNVVKQKDAENDLNEIRQKKADKLAELNKLEEDAQTAAKNHMQATGELTDASGFLTEKYDELKSELADLDQQERDAVETNDNLKEAVERGKEVVEEFKGPVDEASAALEAFSEEQAKANETTGQTTEKLSASQQAVASLDEQIRGLAQAYVEAYDAASESIEGTFGLWEKVGEIATKSAGEQKDALQSQNDYWKEYNTLLSELEERHIPGLKEYLAVMPTGAPETMEAMKGLKKATDDEIKGILDSFRELQSNKDIAKQSAAELKSGFLEGLEGLKEDFTAKVKEIGGPDAVPDFTALIDAVKEAVIQVKTEMENGGKDAADGMKNGIEDNASGASEAAKAMADGVVEAVRDALQIHSPSQVMHDAGVNVGEGLKEGIEESADQAVSAIEKMGSDITDAAEKAAKDSVDGFINEFKEITPQTESEIDELKSAFDELNDLPGEMEDIGGDIVDGMISGIESSSGRLYSTISGVVNSAIEAARDAADTHSPSKKTIQIFEDVGEGMIVGIENKRKEIADTTQDVVNKALEFKIEGGEVFSELITTLNKMNNSIHDDAVNKAIEFKTESREIMSKLMSALDKINNSIRGLDVNTQLDQIEKSIRDLGVNTQKLQTTTSGESKIEVGDIKVDVIYSGDRPEAFEIGREIGTEIKRQMRYRGVM